MITACAQSIGIDHVLFHENRQARGTAAHVHTSRAQFLFILNKARHPRHIGRRGQTREFQITALHAV